MNLKLMSMYELSSFRCSVENMNASAVSEDTKPTPAEFKQKESRQFKSKAPKPGQKG